MNIHTKKVWFQNSRAKDKKMRNQRFNNNNNNTNNNNNNNNLTSDECTTMSHDERENSIPSINLPPTTLTTTTSNTTSTTAACKDNKILRDCNLCQLVQVNLQHSFSIEHMKRVQELLEKTATTTTTTTTPTANHNDFWLRNDLNDPAQDEDLAGISVVPKNSISETEAAATSRVIDDNDDNEEQSENQTTDLIKMFHCNNLAGNKICIPLP